MKQLIAYAVLRDIITSEQQILHVFFQPLQARFETRLIFFNRVELFWNLDFSLTECNTKTKEPNLPYYLAIAG